MIYKMSGRSRLAQSLLAFEQQLSFLHTVVCTCKIDSAIISTTLNLLYKRLKTRVLLAAEEKGISIVNYLQKAI